MILPIHEFGMCCFIMNYCTTSFHSWFSLPDNIPCDEETVMGDDADFVGDTNNDDTVDCKSSL